MNSDALYEQLIEETREGFDRFWRDTGLEAQEVEDYIGPDDVRAVLEDDTLTTEQKLMYVGAFGWGARWVALDDMQNFHGIELSVSPEIDEASRFA